MGGNAFESRKKGERGGEKVERMGERRKWEIIGGMKILVFLVSRAFGKDGKG